MEENWPIVVVVFLIYALVLIDIWRGGKGLAKGE